MRRTLGRETLVVVGRGRETCTAGPREGIREPGPVQEGKRRYPLFLINAERKRVRVFLGKGRSYLP